MRAQPCGGFRPPAKTRYEEPMKRALWTFTWLTLASACSGGEEPAPSTRNRSRETRDRAASQATPTPDHAAPQPISAETTRGRTSALEAPSTNTGPAVTFTLAWPDGARGHVDSARQVTGAGNASGRAQWTFTMHHEPSRNIIDTRELFVEIAPGLRDEHRLNSLLVALSMWPSLALDAQAEVTLRDGEASREAIRAGLAHDLTPQLRELAANSPAGVLFDTSDAALLRLAQAHTASVTSLDGDSFTPGENRNATTSATSAIGIELQQQVVTQLVGTGPCFEGDEANRCAWVTMRATADVEPLQEAAEAAQQPLTIGALVNEARVVVEIATLLPHTITLEKTTSMVVHEGGQDHPVESREVSTWDFHYERESIRQ